VVVQVENYIDARPQSGLADAQIVYEYQAEGGISRFSAVFFQRPPGEIGPIRSARLVTIDLTKYLQGSLMYSGCSIVVCATLAGESFPHYGETAAGPDMFRLGSRYAPHNLYTDGDRVADIVARSSLPAHSYQLWPRAQFIQNGQPISSFSAYLSGAETPTFNWDQPAGGFVRTEPDSGTFTDATSGKPIVIPTVIVQQVSITDAGYVESVNGGHGLAFGLSGTGAAQVFTKGQEFNATWSQPSSGPAQYTLGNGQAAPISEGPVWILLVPGGNPATMVTTAATPVSIPHSAR
jgi:hypothetical protein